MHRQNGLVPTMQHTRSRWFRGRRSRTIAVAAIAVSSVIAGGLTTLALARPTTPTVYPSGASATRFIGLAFDTCAAPRREVMQAWKRSSPYGAIGIYISGDVRACRQRELTADWIRDVSAMGWKFLPIDVGLQAPCADRTKHPMSRDLDTAYDQGYKAGRRAARTAKRLGMQVGSALYSDIESFSSSDVGCADAVRAYLSGWTKRLHDGGYLSGVYGNLQSAVRQLSASHGSYRFLRPDVVWNAQWDGRTALSGWRGVPDHHWPAGQRVKQYLGDHYESYGGHRLHIDSNAVDAPVATVAQPFPITGSQPVTAHTGPSTGQPVKYTRRPGDVVNVVCQIDTPKGRWDKLHDGGWVPDGAVAQGAPKSVLPPCSVPFQVSSAGAWTRSGPGTEYVERRRLFGGSLAWLQCETPGVTLGRPGYWGSLVGGGWISGALLARPVPFGRSVGVPLCEISTAGPLGTPPVRPIGS